MANRKLTHLSIGAYTARVYRDASLDEFTVKFDRMGFHKRDADYHTGDYHDALATALAELRRMAWGTTARPHGVTVDTDGGYTTVTYIEDQTERRFHLLRSEDHRRPAALRDVAEQCAHDAKQAAEAGNEATFDANKERARCALMAAAFLELEA